MTTHKTTELGESRRRRAAVQSSAIERYRRMIEIRLVEEKVLALFGEGLIPGTTHTCQGQEAVCVGLAAATRPTDTVACTYRGHGMALALGATREAVLGEILGREIGCIGGLGGSMHLSDPSVGLLPTMAIVGAGIPIACGAALTSQVLGSGDVAISVFGDGATNIGAFHEGLNLAAVWKLPVVFVCENNVYGEYTRIDRSTPVGDLAVRAGSYAMPSEILDGQDLDAVTETVGRAVARARGGEGPTLIEAKTYRYVGHSRSDQATYRPAGELETWLARDPIALYGQRLLEAGEATRQELDEVRAESAAALERSLEQVVASPSPTPARMFANVRASQVSR
ncbi:MAG TPA: thiamine pyrophosphate-dependent dehydrogenase E1 component subunit alpha [Acidimicrobiales bacterium]|nr:thiamine pyrophosphate-dependent dehydrogenase E1 component subunit alpha [Acidimicrobiales bacterium]